MTQPTHKKQDDFFHSAWRPLCAYVYLAICIFDFILGPIIYNTLQFFNPGQTVEMWTAISLQGGGILHLSFGAIIGIHTHSKTRERIAGVAPSSIKQSDIEPTYVAPVAIAEPGAAVVPPSVQISQFGKIVPPADEPAL